MVLELPCPCWEVSSFQATYGMPPMTARLGSVALRVEDALIGLGPPTGSCQSAAAAPGIASGDRTARRRRPRRIAAARAAAARLDDLSTGYLCWIAGTAVWRRHRPWS